MQECQKLRGFSPCGVSRTLSRLTCNIWQGAACLVKQGRSAIEEPLVHAHGDLVRHLFPSDSRVLQSLHASL
jgi:hypothetical protein